MNQNQTNKSNLLDTTDCLEAVGTFRWWKNVLFVLIAICLLLLQASFWLVNTGYIKTCKGAGTSKPAVADSNAVVVAAKIAADVNEGCKASVPPSHHALFGVTFKNLAWLIRIINAVLVLAATLYCLTMLFSLKISLTGRLGGINHISRAFFLSLVMLVLLLPWQIVFGTAVVGVIYTPCELVKWKATELTDIFGTVLYYLRFSGYWLLIVLLLIFSQLRSARWTKATLRRLEVI
jgi:hypothetical protein